MTTVGKRAMLRQPVIHLYCLCWNEARIIPYFLAHYRGLVDHIFVFDNRSRDASLRLFGGDEAITISHFDITGDSFVDECCRMYNTMWEGSRTVADWVIVVDIDEHLYHANLKGYLRYCASLGITAVPAVGYEMIADRFPAPNQLLWREVTAGCRVHKDFDKLCIFNPNAITNMNYTPGRHAASPEGHVVYPASPEVKLLHYKKLGLSYLKTRWAELRTGLRPGDIANGWGVHYLTPPNAIETDFKWHRQLARTVPGLHSAANADVKALDLHLEIDGGRIDPVQVDGARHVFALPADASRVWIVSGPLNAKHALLGAPVCRVVLRTASDEYELALTDPLATGWWRPVRMLDQIIRWTDGRGLLRLPQVGPGPLLLEIEIAEKLVRAWV